MLTFILPTLPNPTNLTPNLHFQLKIDYRLEKNTPKFPIFHFFRILKIRNTGPNFQILINILGSCPKCIIVIRLIPKTAQTPIA